MPIYSDINQFNPTEKPLLVETEAIYQSLYNIFNTKSNERLFRPDDLEEDLEDLLFDPINEDTEAKIYALLIGKVEQNEPRVSVNYGATSIMANHEKEQYDIKIVFEIEGFKGQSFEYKGVLKK